MTRTREITDEMRHLQEQKNEALRMKLRGEVDAKTFRAVTAEIEAAHDLRCTVTGFWQHCYLQGLALRCAD